MTTLEFMQKELSKQVQNLARQEARNAPQADIDNIKTRIGHYEKVCEVLEKQENAATTSDLKQMIVNLKVSNISASIPEGHCPYSYYHRENPVKECGGDTSCAKCKQIFLDNMRKEIEAEVAKL